MKGITKHRQLVFALTEILLLTAWAGIVAADGPDGNLLTNASFESGIYYLQDGIPEVRVAENWWAFWRELPPPDLPLPNNCPHADDAACYWARPEFQPIEARLYPNRVHNGNFALSYFSWGRMHEAGLFQHVESVPEGSLVRFSIWMMGWQCYDPNACQGGRRSDAPARFHFQIGIDPNGGWDPWSHDVVWSAESETFDEWKLFQVEAWMKNSTAATVFTRSRAEWDWARTNNDVYVDDARLEVIQAAYPDQPLPAPRLVTYTVSEGETLLSIALRYGLTPDQLADINKLPANFRLMAGGTLWVPWQEGVGGNSISLTSTVMVSEGTPSPIATWPTNTNASSGSSNEWNGSRSCVRDAHIRWCNDARPTAKQAAIMLKIMFSTLFRRRQETNLALLAVNLNDTEHLDCNALFPSVDLD